MLLAWFCGLFVLASALADAAMAADYARDRRVRLKFVLPTGEELPIADEEAVDLQVERVLKRRTSARRPGAKPTVRKLR